MTNILSPIFLAENFIAVCAKIDPDFIDATRGRDSDAFQAAKHIENEILATMTREEAAPLVIAAAGHARAIGLGLIRALSGGAYDEQESRVKGLSHDTAEPFVRGVVENHETRHEFFEKMQRDAR